MIRPNVTEGLIILHVQHWSSLSTIAMLLPVGLDPTSGMGGIVDPVDTLAYES